MSLFNNIAQDVIARQSQQGFSVSTRGLIDSTLGSVSNGVSNAFGGGAFGSALGMIASNQLSTAASSAINQTIGSNTLGLVDSGLGIVSDIANGQFGSAGLRLLDSGLLDDFISGLPGIVAQARYLNTATPLFGGITPLQAKAMMLEAINTQYAKKNLYLIEVSSNLLGDVSNRFNLFCTGLNYSAQAITGEKRQIGAGQSDSVKSAEPVELSMTTLDDKTGFIKNWFKQHAAQCVHIDGTVGLPIDYAIKITIVHAFITQDTNYNGYEDVGLFRPATIETDLSRGDDGLEEITLSFSQLDTFYRV